MPQSMAAKLTVKNSNTMPSAETARSFAARAS
jgi:hypothetical protein